MPIVQDCIIGSGSASASLALRLARAGRSVVLVEEGPSEVVPGFGWNDREICRDLLRQGGRHPTEDGTVSIIQGRCLGGSATVSAGIAAPPSPAAVEAWSEAGWSPDLLRSFTTAAAARLEVLGAVPDPEGSRAAGDRVLDRGATALHHAGRWLQRVDVRAPGGALAGPMVAGLDEARRKFGAEIMANTRVEALKIEGPRAVEARGPGVGIVAERYILCTGAIHSAVLLQRSALGGGTAGRALSLPHRVLVLGRMPDPLPPGRAPGAYVVEAPAWTISAADVGPTLYAAHSRGDAATLADVLGDWSRMVALWVTVPEGDGSVGLNRFNQIEVRRGEDPDTLPALQAGAAMAARMLLAAGATEVVLPCDGAGPVTSDPDVAAFEARTLTAAQLPMICQTPQGGCAVGPAGVVDETFAVRGVENVYVADASLFPTSVGPNPMVSVMALGELLGEQLLR